MHARESSSPRPQRKSGLSAGQRRLLELMQSIHFGRIRRLRVRGGEPDLSQPCQVMRTVKMAGQNGAHAASQLLDYELKREIVELFEQLTALGDGMVDTIEVKNGLPFSLEIRASFVCERSRSTKGEDAR